MSNSENISQHQGPYRVLLVGQTPPPYHGQGIMAQRLLNTPLKRVKLYHVRMSFSRDLEEVGQFAIGKVFHLAWVIYQIVYYRFRFDIDTLYYPPSGPKRISIYRDIVILTATRWLFKNTVYHMYAGGVTELIPRLHPLTQWLCRAAYFKPTAVIRLSEFTPNDAEGFEAVHEFIIPNGTDDELSRFKQSHATSGDATIRLLYLSTVCPEKGILELFEACGELRKLGIRFHLDVVGSFQPASFESEVTSALRRHGLVSHVTLNGQLTGDAKYSKFASSDVFCFPSYYQAEASPCALLEAMCFQLPVVSTRWRGIQSIVEHGKTGFLAEIKDADAVAEYLTRLCQDPGLRSQMGTAGRERFLDSFTTERHAAQIESALAAICSGNMMKKSKQELNREKIQVQEVAT